MKNAKSVKVLVEANGDLVGIVLHDLHMSDGQGVGQSALYHAAERFTNGDFRRYAYVCIRNALVAIQPDTRHQTLDSAHHAPELSHDPTDEYDARIDLDNALTHLTAGQRFVYDLYYTQGFTQQEIADTRGITQPAVSKELDKIVAILRRWL